MGALPLPPLAWHVQPGLVWPPPLAEIKSIVVIHLLPLGDFVMLTPFLRNLRTLYPTAKITLATQPLTTQLAQTCPYLDALEVGQHIRQFDNPFDPSAPLAFGLALQNSQFAPFDVCLVPRFDHDHLQANIVAGQLGAKYTIGYSRQTTAFKEKVTPLNYDAGFSVTAKAPNGYHDVQYQLALLNALGATITENQPLELWANADDAAQAEAVLNTFNFTPNQYVIFSMGASQISKIWSIEKFCELGSLICDSYGLKILVLGATDYEIEAASQLVAYLGTDKAQSATARITPRASFLLAAASRMVVTLDTFIAHAAAAAKKPATILYSTPANCPPNDMFHPSRIHPWQSHYNFVQPDSCGPIEQILASHIRSPHCINKITVATAWAQVQAILSS